MTSSAAVRTAAAACARFDVSAAAAAAAAAAVVVRYAVLDEFNALSKKDCHASLSRRVGGGGGCAGVCVR